MRKFHIQTINKFLKEKSDKQKEYNHQNQPSSNKVVGPNVKPSSTYNFKK